MSGGQLENTICSLIGFRELNVRLIGSSMESDSCASTESVAHENAPEKNRSWLSALRSITPNRSAWKKSIRKVADVTNGMNG